MPLYDAQIRRDVHAGAKKRLWDGQGLYLVLRPSGRHWWRLDYRWLGTRKTLSLGTYPTVTIAKAREKRGAIKRQLSDGRDPSLARANERRTRRHAAAQTFERVGREWLNRQHQVFAERTYTKTKYLLERYAFPDIGKLAIASVEPPAILALLQPIEERGRRETAHRVKQICGQILRYAVVTGRATRDATADLRGALLPVQTVSHPAVTDPKAIGALMRAIAGLHGSLVVTTALELCARLFVRPGELRSMAWADLDLAAKLWRIPAEKMKMKQPHLVPLPTQAVALLTKLRSFGRGGLLVFPSARTTKRPMSDNTLNACLRRLGYGQEEMVAHGFRSIASTRLNELGWAPDLIELQLAHRDPNTVRAVYNRSQRLDERAAMMQAYSDELDRLRDLA